MSFIQYTVQCEDCKKYYNTVFGMQGMELKWDPAKICPKCNGKLEKVADGWEGDRLNKEQKEKEYDEPPF